jgi:hypothetical protein
MTSGLWEMSKELWTAPEGYENSMIPLDEGKSIAELVSHHLHNCSVFDKVPENRNPDLPARTHRQTFLRSMAIRAARCGWTADQCRSIAALQKTRPPDRLYRVRGGLYSASHGYAPLTYIQGYIPARRGQPAMAECVVLGVAGGQLGGAENVLVVPAEGLEDVHQQALAGRLRELLHR